MAIGYLEAVGYLYGYRNIHLRHIKEMPGSHRAFGRAREHLPAPYQEDAGAFARAYATLPGHYPHHTKKMLEVPYTQMLRFFFASLHEQAARTSGGQAKHARDALSAW